MANAANDSDRDRRALLYTYQPAGLRTQYENTRISAAATPAREKR